MPFSHHFLWIIFVYLPLQQLFCASVLSADIFWARPIPDHALTCHPSLRQTHLTDPDYWTHPSWSLPRPLSVQLAVTKSEVGVPKIAYSGEMLSILISCALMFFQTKEHERKWCRVIYFMNNVWISFVWVICPYSCQSVQFSYVFISLVLCFGLFICPQGQWWLLGTPHT